MKKELFLIAVFSLLLAVLLAGCAPKPQIRMVDERPPADAELMTLDEVNEEVGGGETAGEAYSSMISSNMITGKKCCYFRNGEYICDRKCLETQ